jgi:hypothetical protein
VICTPGGWPDGASRIATRWPSSSPRSAPRFAARPGGYTRILKLGHRPGDGADIARIELLEA